MTWVNGEWVHTPDDDWARDQPAERPLWQHKVRETPRLPGESLADWGYRVGAYGAEDVPRYRAREADEQRRVLASGAKPDGPTPLELEIGDCFPAYAPGMSTLAAEQYDPGDPRRVLAAAGLDPYTGQQVRASSGTATDTPLLDQLDLATRGPTREQRYRAQDLQAERELAALDERERRLADPSLSDEDWLRAFQGLD